MSAASAAGIPAIGLAERERARTGLDQKRVDVAVIATLEFDDLVPAGESSGETDRGHRGLGAAIHHPHFLDRRHPLTDFAREFDFQRIRNAEARAAIRRRLHRRDDRRMRVAEDRRAPGADVIDLAVAVDVLDA